MVETIRKLRAQAEEDIKQAELDIIYARAKRDFADELLSRLADEATTENAVEAETAEFSVENAQPVASVFGGF